MIDTVIKVAKRIAPKFAFGIHDEEDMIQEAIIMGMECLDRYDPDRGKLEHFVARHISNRLRTFVRKHNVKAEPNVPTSSLEHVHWYRSFGAKKMLLEAAPIEEVEHTIFKEDNHLEQMELDEIQRIIDRHLPVEYRADYLRMLNNIHVPKARRLKIKNMITDILKDHNYETW